jgi:hypothetical protein
MSISGPQSRKVVRSYRLVFRRRWRIFRLQGWRIPLPGGLELRALGYWLACLVLGAVLAKLPLLGAIFSTVPAALRLLALPIAAAWALSRWELDGRSPHRALFGILAWRLRPRRLAALRPCLAERVEAGPLGPVAAAPDLYGPSYPRGRLKGPARILLRYPVEVRLGDVPRGVGSGRDQQMAGARRWHLRQADGAALHRGRTLEVPAGKEVVFE